MHKPLMPVAKSVLIIAALATVVWVSAGDLNPPPGPISPTQRTPIGENTTPGDATTVFKIIQPGSYYLTANVKGVNGKHGIFIDASNVTLDLMGFSVEGAAGSLDGIHVLNLLTNVSVVNGSVRSWGGEGVQLASVRNVRLADLRVSGNGSSGIRSGAGSVVTGCSSYQNGAYGFIVTSNGVLTNCTALENSGAGFNTGSGCTITNCSASGNTLDGFDITNTSTIANSAAHANLMSGFKIGGSCTVTNCTAAFNTTDGFRVGNSNKILGNQSNSNGNAGGDGAGIHVTGTDNHIDGNNSTNNDRGIDVDAAANFITRNTCSGNTTNWDVVAANNILVVLVVDAPAVLGNSGGVSPGSTDPNANYSY